MIILKTNIQKKITLLHKKEYKEKHSHDNTESEHNDRESQNNTPDEGI